MKNHKRIFGYSLVFYVSVITRKLVNLYEYFHPEQILVPFPLMFKQFMHMLVNIKTNFLIKTSLNCRHTLLTTQLNHSLSPRFYAA
jgi:hypothetical protein